MAALSIEITAPEIVSALNHLAGALVNATNSALHTNNPLPQTLEEQASRPRAVVPGLENHGPVSNQPAAMPRPSAPQPVPTAPITQQPQYPQYPTPPQQYRPAAPVNPTPIAPMPNNRTMGAVNTAPAAAPAPVPPAPIAPSTNQAPVAAAPAYQIDDLARAAAQLMDAGKQQDLLALLGQFNVQTLGQLPPEQFGGFATALRQMGAKI